MSRGNSPQVAKRRHTLAAQRHAGELVDARAQLDGMTGNDPRFETVLEAALEATVALECSSTKMDRDGSSRRAVVERQIATAVTRAAA